MKIEKPLKTYSTKQWRKPLLCKFYCSLISCLLTTTTRGPPRGGGVEESTSLKEATGDVPLVGVAFSRLDWLSWGRIFNKVSRMGWYIFWVWGKTVLHIYSKATKLGSQKWHICPKVTKMGPTIGHRIDYNWVGTLRGQRHIPSKNWPK